MKHLSLISILAAAGIAAGAVAGWAGGRGAASSPLPKGNPGLGSASGETPSVICGCIMNSRSIPEYGVYAMQSDMGDITSIAISDDFQAWACGTMAGDKYLIYNFGSNKVSDYKVFDSTTWRVIKSDDNGPGNLNATCVSWNPVDQTVYGCFYVGNGTNKYEFGKLDVNTMTRTTISSLGTTKYYVMACNAVGDVYAIDGAGALFKLNKQTGASTKIGTTGKKPHVLGINGGCFDFEKDIFYYIPASSTFSETLYSVDVNTAALTEVRSIPGGSVFTGIWVGEPLADADAPNKVSNLGVTFPGASLEGEVFFTLPEVTYSGTQGTAPLGYTVECNGDTIASATPSMTILWGSEVSVPASVPSEGVYTFRVCAKTSAGDGPWSESTYWLGNDYPRAPKNVKVEYSQSEGKYNLTWERVTQSFHNGHFDASGVTYNVYDSGLTCIASGLTANSFQETSAIQPVKYYYVSAVHAGLEGEKTISNALGAYSTPFFESFDTEDMWPEWTVIDANGDGIKWEYPTYMRTQGYAMINKNRNLDMDDWLITPPVMMQPGKEYDLYLKLQGTAGALMERVALKMGGSPDVEGMTVDLLPANPVSGDSVRWKVSVRVPHEGAWYFGVHGVSPANAGQLHLLEFSLEDGMSLNAPGAGTLSVAPDYDCALKAVLTYTLPTKTVDGGELEDVTKVEFYRDGTLVKSETGNWTPGATVTFSDEVNMTLGDHEWRAVPYNAEGAGKPVLADGYVGVRLPGAVSNVKISERENTGVMDISWDAPATDINGKPLDPSMVRYIILDKNYNKIQMVNYNHVTLSSNNPQVQQFAAFGVIPVTDAGENSNGQAWSESIPVGAAYPLPFHESCPSEFVENNWTRDGSDLHHLFEPIWASGTPDCEAQDGDCGLWGWIPGEVGNETWLYSGKVQLDDNNPVLSFWYRAIGGQTDKIEVIIRDYKQMTDYEVLKSVTLGETGKEDWVKVFVPLDDYAGKTIQFGFHDVCDNRSFLHLIDNIHIEEGFEDDMALVKLDKPLRVTAGEEYRVVARIENTGMTGAEDVKAQLWRDGKLVAEEELGAMEPGESKRVELADTTVTTALEETATYNVVVTADYDDNAANDESGEYEVTVVKVPVPAVAGLTGVADGGTVKLSWPEPDYSAGCPSHVVTEDFEGAESWAMDDVAGWQFIDGDGSYNLGLRWMNYPTSGEECAFTVMDSDYPLAALPGVHLTAHSGTKWLGSWVAANGPNDDWLISPPLQGVEQTVKFWARSWGTDDLESVNVYSSVSTPDKSRFHQLGETITIPAEWTEFSFKVPAKTKYFAIQCVSNDKIVLYLDDITFDIGGGPLVLKGYNVFRDGVKVNAEPVTATNFSVEDDGEAEHNWHVTALYDRGESVPSNSVDIQTAGVGSVAARAGVRTEGDRIVVEGVAGSEIRVWDASGMLRAAVKEAAATEAIGPMERGIYIVKAGMRVYKVIVK